MTRRLVGVVAIAAALAAVIVVVATGRAQSGYRVRAIFDSAANVIPGEDVKIAGAKVGERIYEDLALPLRALRDLGQRNLDFSLFKNSKSAQQNVSSFVGNKTTDKNEFTIAVNVCVHPEDVIVIGISDHFRRHLYVAGNGLTNGDVFHPRQKRALDSIIPTDSTCNVSNPGLMH